MDADMIRTRLLNLRESQNLSQVELGRRIGINNTIINKIESGTRSVSAEELGKFADFYDVSTDYLLGKTDKRHYYDLSQKEEADLADLAKQLLEGTTTDAEVNFDGEPMTAEAKANLHTAILTALEINKRNAKQKFTPKKYRGSESDKD